MNTAVWTAARIRAASRAVGWRGVPMYFAGHSVEKNRELVAEAGLHVVSVRLETIEEEDTPTFLWAVARKPR
jgi:hypothetical protein